MNAVGDMADKLGLKTKQGRELLYAAVQLVHYGPRNIDEFGILGVVVRMNDKMERIKNLLRKDKQAACEAYMDSFKDMAGYALIGVLLEEKKWS
jgi:predicted class III extradiol MEMO1 family dioxygenase